MCIIHIPPCQPANDLAVFIFHHEMMISLGDFLWVIFPEKQLVKLPDLPRFHRLPEGIPGTGLVFHVKPHNNMLSLVFANVKEIDSLFTLKPRKYHPAEYVFRSEE